MKSVFDTKLLLAIVMKILIQKTDALDRLTVDYEDMKRSYTCHSHLFLLPEGSSNLAKSIEYDLPLHVQARDKSIPQNPTAAHKHQL